MVEKGNQIEDKELLNRYVETEDLEVLAQLFMPYMHLVLGTCLKYLEDRDMAKDAVQEIYHVVSKDVLKTDVKQFKSWLYVVTKNYCYMVLRKNKREQDKLKEFSLGQVVENDNLDHLFEKSEEEIQLLALNKCMEGLKALQRKCVDMFYINSKCYQEISDDLALTLKEVKSHIQNGKRNLKICIEKRANEA